MFRGAWSSGSPSVIRAARRDFFDHFVVADYDLTRAEAAVAALGDEER
ncbi:ATP-binding protein, partial [Streptomyces goshikiensis]